MENPRKTRITAKKETAKINKSIKHSLPCAVETTSNKHWINQPINHIPHNMSNIQTSLKIHRIRISKRYENELQQEEQCYPQIEVHISMLRSTQRRLQKGILPRAPPATGCKLGKRHGCPLCLGGTGEKRFGAPSYTKQPCKVSWAPPPVFKATRKNSPWRSPCLEQTGKPHLSAPRVLRANGQTSPERHLPVLRAIWASTCAPRT